MNFETPEEWTEEDLEGLIESKVEESTELEYKACASLDKTDDRKTDMSTDISAFANSNGGIIIYGIKEDRKTGKPKEIDTGFKTSELPKEWLENVIYSRVKPPLGDIKIHSISLDKASPGKVAYAVIVPRGKTCHQASDGRYYRRTNTSNRILEDWEIREIMNRARSPRVTPFFRASPTAGTDQSLHIQLTNDGDIRAKDLKLVFTLPSFIVIRRMGFHARKISDGTESQHFEQTEYTIQRSDCVLFPRDSLELTDSSNEFLLKSRQGQDDHTLFEIITANHPVISWQVYADDMSSIRGEIKLEEVPGFEF